MSASALHFLHVIGARPNFVKIAPLLAALEAASRPVRQTLVHTGQHYDAELSELILAQLGLPRPDVALEAVAGSSAQRIACMMERLEPVVRARRPDWAVVVGDVDSTLAGAQVCAKLGVPVAHVEAGLRSFPGRGVASRPRGFDSTQRG